MKTFADAPENHFSINCPEETHPLTMSLDTWDDDQTRAVAVHGHTAAAYIRYAGCSLLTGA